MDAVTGKVAAGLLRLGLKPRDRVIFQLTNTPETLVSFLACWKAGIIPICTLAPHREAEIGYLGEFGGTKAPFIETDASKFDFAAFAKKMQGQISAMNLIISTRGPSGDGIVDLAELIQGELGPARDALAEIVQDPWQVAAFQLSGGTTGVPKIIRRIHAEYLYNRRQVAAFRGWTSDDRICVPMPFADMTDDQCQAFVENLYSDDLQGRRLISNKSEWRNFQPVWFDNWTHGHRVPIGDAVRRAHFSIGSGTRIAMEDPIALAKALESERDISAALDAYVAARKPAADMLIGAARESYTWYENMGQHMADAKSVHDFAFDYLTRTNRVDGERVAADYPAFLAA